MVHTRRPGGRMDWSPPGGVIDAGESLIEGLTRVFYPEGSAVVLFVIMAIVLMWKPAGLFGRTA